MTWRVLGSWFVAVVLVSPLSWRLFVVQDKPVDLIPSDLLLLALPICFWRRLSPKEQERRRRSARVSRPRRPIDRRTHTRRGDLRSAPVARSGDWPQRWFLLQYIVRTGHETARPEEISAAATWMRRLVLMLVLYCGVSAAAGWIQSGGTDGTRLLSAAKFVKPLLFVWIGSSLAIVDLPSAMLRRIGWAFAGTALVWGVSTLGSTGFPESVWGRQWLGIPVLGFPNTAMTFAAAMLPLLLAVAESTGRRAPKAIAALAAAAMFVLVVCSLSRCAVVVMLSGIAVYWLLTGWRWAPIGFAGVAVLFIGTGYSLMVLRSDSIGADHPTLQERAAHRFVRPVNTNSGALSGRSAIWNETWELIAARPLCGYAFAPYSRHATFDTPHQQYLEVLYKTGFIGLALYLGVFWMALTGLVRLGCAAINNADGDNVIETRRLLAATCGLMCGVLIGNLSQANLTYPLTGNCVFLILGLVIHPRCAAGLAAGMACPESIRLGTVDAPAIRRAA